MPVHYFFLEIPIFPEQVAVDVKEGSAAEAAVDAVDAVDVWLLLSAMRGRRGRTEKIQFASRRLHSSVLYKGESF